MGWQPDIDGALQEKEWRILTEWPSGVITLAKCSNRTEAIESFTRTANDSLVKKSMAVVRLQERYVAPWCDIVSSDVRVDVNSLVAQPVPDGTWDLDGSRFTW